MKFKVGDRCVVVDTFIDCYLGQVVIIESIRDEYYRAVLADGETYPFIESELELRPWTKLEKALS